MPNGLISPIQRSQGFRIPSKIPKPSQIKPFDRESDYSIYRIGLSKKSKSGDFSDFVCYEINNLKAPNL
jgi:hypothetical protein